MAKSRKGKTIRLPDEIVLYINASAWRNRQRIQVFARKVFEEYFRAHPVDQETILKYLESEKERKEEEKRTDKHIKAKPSKK